MARIVSLEDYQNIKNIQAAIGDGRNLALNPDQTNKLHDNAKGKITTFQNTVVSEPAVMNEEIAPAENIVNEPDQPIVEPVISPVIDTPFSSVEMKPENVKEVTPDISNVILEQPKDAEIPSIIEPQVPVVDEAPVLNQVEIVSEVKENELFAKIITSIQQINTEYDEKIKELNHERNAKLLQILEESKEGFIAEQNQIMDLKQKAEEHLKNAQAAEQIATIAHQNAQNIQNISTEV